MLQLISKDIHNSHVSFMRAVSILLLSVFAETEIFLYVWLFLSFLRKWMLNFNDDFLEFTLKQ